MPIMIVHVLCSFCICSYTQNYASIMCPSQMYVKGFGDFLTHVEFYTEGGDPGDPFTPLLEFLSMTYPHFGIVYYREKMAVILSLRE